MSGWQAHRRQVGGHRGVMWSKITYSVLRWQRFRTLHYPWACVNHWAMARIIGDIDADIPSPYTTLISVTAYLIHSQNYTRILY